MSNGISGGQAPRHPDILKVGPKEALVVRLLSPQLVRWQRHWADRKPQPCYRLFGLRCVACDAGGDPQRSYWAEARRTDTKAVGLVEITAGAFDHCPQLQRAADQARGLLVRLSRLASRYGGMRAEVCGHSAQVYDCPRAQLDVWQCLLRLYRLSPSLLADALAAERADAANADSNTQAIPNVAGKLEALADKPVILRLNSLFGDDAVKAWQEQQAKRAVGDGLAIGRGITDTSTGSLADRLPVAAVLAKARAAKQARDQADTREGDDMIPLPGH